MPHVSRQVVAPTLTDLFHWMHCVQIFQQAGIDEQVHRAELEQYPQDVIQDAGKQADWLFDLAQHYGDQFQIQVINSLTLRGFLLSLRHQVQSYPAFIGKDRTANFGWDRKALDCVL